jgi:flagellar protein FliS
MNQYAKAYTATDNYSGVAYADPHTLITKMFDGALKYIAQAKGAILRQEVAVKGEQIGRAIAIIGNLDACLNLEQGGELSRNLSSLYEYMNLRLAEANITNDIAKLDEVSGLISEIRGGWVQIPQQLEARAG